MLASFLGYILYIIHNTAHDPNIVYNNMNSHFLSGGLFYYTLLHGIYSGFSCKRQGPTYISLACSQAISISTRLGRARNEAIAAWVRPSNHKLHVQW